MSIPSYRIRASRPSVSSICKWHLVQPWSRPSSTATPTSAKPMLGRGSSVSSSGITPGGSQRSAACRFTIRIYLRWRRLSILPRRRCVWPNGLTIRPVSFRRGFELSDPDTQFSDWPGSHPGLQCQLYPMLISWMLGYPDRSLDELRAVVGSAETLRHPVTLVRALCYAALVHSFRHEPSVVADHA